MLAISLSAAAGFRVFVPLLALSAASVLGHVDLPTNFDWIENPQALGLFAIACVLEIIGYSIPWMDHLLDILATPAAIITGTIVAASVAPEMDPLVKWTLALAAGGGTAGLTKGLMNILRATSTAVSGGLTNPIFSALELAIAAVLSALAITVPAIAAAVVVGVLGFAIYKIRAFFVKFQDRQTNA
jgi:phage-related minor tail protein